ncbi:MAG: aminoglycoside phosphotransferase family protein [Deltaproteobacteria bacterium]
MDSSPSVYRSVHFLQDFKQNKSLILLSILVILRSVPKTTLKPIQVWISEWLSKSGLSTDFSVSLLLGDGSTRSFYRVSTSKKNFILISDPQWIQTQDYPAHQKFLIDLKIPVPEFYIADPENGFLLMQDLGDELLQHRISKNPDQKLIWLKKSATLLAELHGETFPVPTSVPVTTRFFDTEKYLAEFQFTFEHLSQKLLNQPKLSESQISALKTFCNSISSFQPLVFTHRDYHCRNLLVFNEHLVMIDFQDARMGPPHYDLASLIYDAYVPLNDTERKEILNIYQDRLSQFPVSKQIHWPSFERELKAIAFQRTVKAAGSFASFFIRFGKTTHWPYLIPALTSAQRLQAEGFGVNPQVINLENWITLISQIKIE